MDESNKTLTGIPLTYSSNTDKTGKQEPGVSNTWKFLAGVIVIALCTSMFIVCAVKSPSWYKMLFNYRHQRLRETSDEDGFIEDRYIQITIPHFPLFATFVTMSVCIMVFSL
uniref:Leucine-rich repeat-containing protein 19-like n=1 Tax=Astyanax mexicanus TaxID=7994 RepID=A0A3B1ISG3_ASTMX